MKKTDCFWQAVPDWSHSNRESSAADDGPTGPRNGECRGWRRAQSLMRADIRDSLQLSWHVFGCWAMQAAVGEYRQPKCSTFSDSQAVLLSLALVLEVSSRTNFESLALALKVKSLALALSRSPWPGWYYHFWIQNLLQPMADQVWQEAQLSQRDRAMRRVHLNLANCHATVQKLLIRQVLTKSMVWSWRFSRRQCVTDIVHSTMTRSSRLPLSQVRWAKPVLIRGISSRLWLADLSGRDEQWGWSRSCM